MEFLSDEKKFIIFISQHHILSVKIIPPNTKHNKAIF